MATMISGASLMDGAVLLIAANEPCPQPQTKEHLRGLEIAGVKNIVIVQNKIDLVSEEKALEHYRQIQEFVKGTIADEAPIIPVSAHHDVNLDVLISGIESIIKTPEHDSKLPSRMSIARSFDVNKPGTPPRKLLGGVIGGSLAQGILKKDDELEINPGIKIEEKGKSHWESLNVIVHSLIAGGGDYDEISPGGLSAVGTLSDPILMKSDALTGKVLGKVDTLPPVWNQLSLEIKLMDRLVGTLKDMDIEKIRSNQPLMMNAGTATTVGIVTSARDDYIDATLKLPICAEPGQRVALSRNIAGRWHLIGYGILQG
jgi:translation initiation factor 2 subunit 3